MKRSERQRIFTANIGKLIAYAAQIGIGLTFGEAYRTHSQQLLDYYGYAVAEGKTGLIPVKAKKSSWTKNSRHLCRLAVDFNFFIEGQLTYDAELIEPLGNYWERLHPDNVWGGRWRTKDVPHFEMKP